MKPSLQRIDSPQNPRIKELVRLRSRNRTREDLDLCIIEGSRELARALASGFEPLQVFVCEESLSDGARRCLEDLSAERVDVGPAVFEKIAVREESGGVIAIVKRRFVTLEDLNVQPARSILVTENIQKPGNLGAILRTADAVGVSGIILLGATCDPFSSNAVRASLGTSFTVPLVRTDNESLRAFLELKKLPLIVAHPDAEKSLYDLSLAGEPVAALVGSEADGVSTYWLEHATHRARIPMAGIADSLNVSVACAVLLYELRRQQLLS